MMPYSGSRKRFKEMYFSDWYDHYLMKYVRIIERPFIDPKKSRRFTEKLLEWNDNTQFSYMEDYVYGEIQEKELC